MIKNWIYGLVAISVVSCTAQQNVLKATDNQEVVIAFGSCDNQRLPNDLWDDIANQNPVVWIWGGDNVYCDTNDMTELAKCYDSKLQDPKYKNFKEKINITGTWDDHDYARNDGGEEFEHKKASQQLFLDFMNVPKNDARRKQEGVYNDLIIKTAAGKSIQILNLDTRYFRSALTPNPSAKKRYMPQETGTILGEAQWQWLEKKLMNSKSDFNIIVSSIQVLSDRHGFESWGNMPNEVKKLESLIARSKAKGVIIVSGDRHIAEFSKKSLPGLTYPLVDFTSSGLTHVYEAFKSEDNPYRIGNVINKKNFGILRINMMEKKVSFEIRGDGNIVFEEFSQKY